MKVNGRWCYLYRAIDRDGNVVDSILSEHRETAKRFLAQARDVVGHAPKKVTTDGYHAYPRAIRRVLGRKVVHRTSRLALIERPHYRIEQDHRGIKQRYYSMGGFCSFKSASRFCSALDEQRQFFRYRTRPNQKVPLLEQRQMFRQRFSALQYLLMAA